MKGFFLFISLLLLFTACDSQPEKKAQQPNSSEIPLLLKEQQACWNKADIDGYMSYYWRSDSLKFMTKNGLSKGWKTVYENYISAYPTKEKMGQLQFDILHQKDLKSSSIVLGKWQVFRSEDTLRGHFSLLWEVVDGQWKIVFDHSS